MELENKGNESVVENNQATAGTEGQSNDQAVNTSTEAVTQSEETAKVKLPFGEYSPDEIKQWHESHSNYNKWNKELTQRSQKISEYEKFAENWEKASNQERRNWLEQYLPKEDVANMSNQQVANNPYANEVNSLKSELSEIKQILNQQREQTLASQIRSKFDTVKSQFKDQWTDYDEKIIRNTYVATGQDIAEIAKEHFENMGKRSAKKQADYVEGKVKDQSNKAFVPKGNTGGIPAKNPAELSSDERIKGMTEELVNAGFGRGV